MYDAFVDAWMIAAGAVEPPDSVPEDLRRAASILLALPRLGLAEEFFIGQERRLEALGGAWREGARLLPLGQGERADLFRAIFGARKQVMTELGLQPVEDAAGRVRDPLPRPRTGGKDAPPRSAVRKLVEWLKRRDVPAEFISGPLDGLDLDEIPDRLDQFDEVWREEGASLRILVGPTPIGVRVGPGTGHPFDASACSRPRGCTQYCPFFGAGTMCIRRDGIGWDLAARSDDRRRVHQMPRLPGTRYLGEDTRRRTPAAA